jgi:SAM-dependent methyltransferase
MTGINGPDAVHDPISRARYDGWAGWYDAYAQGPLYADLPGHLLRLAGSGAGVCVDAGCGTGVHLEALASLGWSVVGLERSADMLRLARQRCPAVVQADAARMPFPDAFVSRVASVLTLTDLDDVGPFFCEVARVLVPGGRLVILTTHPCFVGPFVEMEEGAGGVAIIHPGYRSIERVFEGPGLGEGIRSRVGVRHVSLSELLNKLIASGLDLVRVEEIGKRVVPWLLALVAAKQAAE